MRDNTLEFVDIKKNQRKEAGGGLYPPVIEERDEERRLVNAYNERRIRLSAGAMGERHTEPSL